MLKIIYKTLYRIHRYLNKEPEVSEKNAEEFVKNMYVRVVNENEIGQGEREIDLIIGCLTGSTIHPFYYPNFFIANAKIIQMKHSEYGRVILVKVKTKDRADKLCIKYNGSIEMVLDVIPPITAFPMLHIPKPRYESQ